MKLKSFFSPATLTITLVLTLFSSNAFADYIRIWRGYKQTDLSQSVFVDRLNYALFPATGALAHKQANLTNYLPVVIDASRAQTPLPDEVALLSYQDEQSYRAYRETAEGQHYGDLHWDMFDRQTSRSLVPTAWQGKVDVENAYTVVGYDGDWSDGVASFSTIEKVPKETESQYLSAVNQRIIAVQATDPKAYYVLVAQTHAIEYVLYDRSVEQVKDDGIVYATKLLNNKKLQQSTGGLVYPVSETSEQPQVRSTWQHHIDAWIAKDLEAIVADYSESSVVIHNDRIFRGKDDIREIFAELFARFDEATDTQIDRLTIENNVVYITWWAQFPDMAEIVKGTDTFVIEDGVITTQTIAAFPW